MVIVRRMRHIRTSHDIRGFHKCLHATGLPATQRALGVLPALRLARAGRRLAELYGW